MAKAPAPFRYAGLLTLGVLGLLALGGAIAGPLGYYRRPEVGSGDPRWGEARRWVAEHAGFRLLVCRAPADQRKAGRLRIGPDDAPSFWDGDLLVQAVPDGERGALLRGDAGVEGWASWRGTACRWTRPSTFRIEGRRVDGQGRGAPGVVEGCGASTMTSEDGTFLLTLGPEALAVAVEDEAGPACALGSGGPPTLVALTPGGARSVLVQAGPEADPL